MARLYEYQGKQLLRKAKVPIPQGEVATSPQEAVKIAEKIGKPVAVKVQIWAGGRGKAGGIKIAEHPLDARIAAQSLLGSEIKKWKVEKVLVEEKLDIDKEYYVGVIIDPSMGVRSPVVMFSTEGGMEIETVPPEKIAQMTVDVLRGFRLYDALNLAVQMKGRVEQLFSARKGYANSGQLRMEFLSGLAFLADGRLLIADDPNNLLRTVDGKRLTDWLGAPGDAGDKDVNGRPPEARVRRPAGLCVTGDGTVFVAPAAPRSSPLRKVDGKTRAVSTWVY